MSTPYLPHLPIPALLDLYAAASHRAELLRRNGHSGNAAVAAKQDMGAIVAEVERRAS